MVVPRFVRQALQGEPLTVYGDGSQTRCFTHVADSVRGLIGVMDAEQCTGEVFNIGNSEEVSILALANRVIAAAKSSSSIQFVSFADAYEESFEDMPRRVPTTEKIFGAIGWKAEYGLDSILEAVVSHARASESPRRVASHARIG